MAAPQMHRLDEVIGDNLRWLRNREDITQQRLAEYLTELTDSPWDQPTVSLAERGRRPFRVVDLIAVAWAFQVSMVRLLQPRIRAHEHDHVLAGTMAIGPGDVLDFLIITPRFGSRSGAEIKTDFDTTWPPPLGNLEDRIRQIPEGSS